MSTSVIGSQLDAIRAGLAARPGLAQVNVFSGPVSVDEAELECVAFGDGTLDEAPAAMGGSRLETWSVEGEIRIVSPWQGSTEATIKAARDRGAEILAEVETYLNDTYTGTLPDVDLTAGTIAQSYNPDGRVCSLLFTLAIKTVKNP